jgi:hypothetical protein
MFGLSQILTGFSECGHVAVESQIPTVSIPLTDPEDRSTFAIKKHLTLPGPDDIPHSALFLISRLGACLKRPQFSKNKFGSSDRPPRHSELQRNAASQVRSDAGVSNKQF